jgi:RNA polymerase sigma factor (sigma-70 family)
MTLNRGMGDAQLLRDARRDPEAFCRFYERHVLRVRSWLRRETGSTEVANDLTAETFAQALVSLKRFKGREDEQAVAWLYAIARNLLYQYRRRQRVDTAARERLHMPVRDYGGFDDSDDLVDAQRLAPRLYAALEELSEGERVALGLRVVDDLRFDEVASRLELASPAVRMRVTRALRALRARLEGAA